MKKVLYSFLIFLTFSNSIFSMVEEGSSSSSQSNDQLEEIVRRLEGSLRADAGSESQVTQTQAAFEKMIDDLIETLSEESWDEELTESIIDHAWKKYPDLMTSVEGCRRPDEAPRKIKEKVKRKGKAFLLYGPSGTGKTELAIALGHYIGGDIKFISGANVPDQWSNSDSKNFHKILNRFKNVSTPTVLIIDEITGLLQKKENRKGEKAEVSNCSTAFWSNLDKCLKNKNFIFIGTGNDISDFPSAVNTRTVGGLYYIDKSLAFARTQMIERLNPENGLTKGEIVSVEYWTRHLDLRTLDELLRDACEYAERRIIDNPSTQNVRLTKKDVWAALKRYNNARILQGEDKSFSLQVVEKTKVAWPHLQPFILLGLQAAVGFANQWSEHRYQDSVAWPRQAALQIGLFVAGNLLNQRMENQRREDNLAMERRREDFAKEQQNDQLRKSQAATAAANIGMGAGGAIGGAVGTGLGAGVDILCGGLTAGAGMYVGGAIGTAIGGYFGRAAGTEFAINEVEGKIL